MILFFEVVAIERWRGCEGVGFKKTKKKKTNRQ